MAASGHYNTPRLPSIPGLIEWREAYSDRVEHSKSYRHPEQYAGKVRTSSLRIKKIVANELMK